MASFEPAFNATLVNEGFPGYATDNNGAEVCAGINRAYWPGWGGWPLIDALKAKGLDRKGVNSALGKEPKLLPLVQDFYRRNFWAPMYDRITAQSVASWLFDKAVNCNTPQAVKFIQRAAGVDDDGRFGPATLAAINGADPARLVIQARAQAKAFYQRLHEKDPNKYPASMIERA